MTDTQWADWTSAVMSAMSLTAWESGSDEEHGLAPNPQEPAIGHNTNHVNYSAFMCFCLVVCLICNPCLGKSVYNSVHLAAGEQLAITL